MTRTEFTARIAEHGVDPSLVIFDDPVRDGWGVRQNHYRWEVFFRERGVESDALGYPSESDALLHLFQKLTGETSRTNL